MAGILPGRPLGPVIPSLSTHLIYVVKIPLPHGQHSSATSSNWQAILTLPPCTPLFVTGIAPICGCVPSIPAKACVRVESAHLSAGRQRRQEKPMTYYVIQGLLYIDLGVVILLHAIERL